MDIININTQIVKCSFDELQDAQKELINESKEATKGSYSPYSHYAVGAALRLQDGTIVRGSNQENAAYPSGLCAERVTMFYANAAYPNVAPVELALSVYTNGDFSSQPGTPCGACRQVLLETEQRYGVDLKIYLYGRECVYIVNSVKDLLPLSFTSDYLK